MMTDIPIPDCFMTLDKKFNRELTQDEVHNLSKEDFIQYLREKTWEKICEDKGIRWEDLSYWDKSDIDLETLMRVAIVMNKVCNEDNEEEQKDGYNH